jgi:hypothetical protein
MGAAMLRLYTRFLQASSEFLNPCVPLKLFVCGGLPRSREVCAEREPPGSNYGGTPFAIRGRKLGDRILFELFCYLSRFMAKLCLLADAAS